MPLSQCPHGRVNLRSSSAPAAFASVTLVMLLIALLEGGFAKVFMLCPFFPPLARAGHFFWLVQVVVSAEQLPIVWRHVRHACVAVNELIQPFRVDAPTAPQALSSECAGVNQLVNALPGGAKHRCGFLSREQMHHWCAPNPSRLRLLCEQFPSC